MWVEGAIERFQQIRQDTEKLCEPLLTEDYVVQSMPDASPPKWHLAHTSWFFETFLLLPELAGYHPFHPAFAMLFNSYYKSVGPQFERSRRGTLSRPGVSEIYKYRSYVDHHVVRLLHERPDPRILSILELGCQHEQQHQELLLMDVKHAFWSNPLRPAYLSRPVAAASGGRWEESGDGVRWIEFDEGIREIGASGNDFAFDNERPRHRELQEAFRISARMVTNAEFLEFILAGGYRDPSFWLSDGWDAVQRHGWAAPLYWERQGSGWMQMTLSGMRPLDPEEPVVHVSFFEADAFARWKGKRLPTEGEWETGAAASRKETGNFLEDGVYHPRPACGNRQFLGDAWEWTASPYRPYPGFRPLDAALGEYNGKFMCNQMVLKGGACVTPREHARITYRNFFAPDARWMFAGFRIAD